MNVRSYKDSPDTTKPAPPAVLPVFARFADGSSSPASSGAGRFFAADGGAGVGVAGRGFSFFPGWGSGDGSTSAGASHGWLGLH